MKKVFSFFAFVFGSFAGGCLPVALLAEFSNTGHLHSIMRLWTGIFVVSIISGVISEKGTSGVLYALFPGTVFSGAVFLIFGVEMLYGVFESASFMLSHEVVFSSLSTQSKFGYIFTIIGLVILVLFAIYIKNETRKMEEDSIK